jgi:hypothetical protein
VGDHLPKEQRRQDDVATQRRQVPSSPLPPHAPERTGAGSYAGGVSERLYFRQLLSGRDFAESDPIAGQMVNFVYAIGDRDTGDTVLVDPAYDVQRLLDIVAEDEMSVTGVLATHYHPDHVGGTMMGLTIPGVRELLDIVSLPVHVQQAESEWVKRAADLTDDELVTPRVTPRAVSASSSTDAWSQETRCSSRAAAAPTFRARTPARCSRASTASGTCPTTSCCSRATATPSRRRPLSAP